jgi:hypothetical protein
LGAFDLFDPFVADRVVADRGRDFFVALLLEEQPASSSSATENHERRRMRPCR